MSTPITPQPPNATLPEGTLTASQSSNMTPPPSTQVPTTARPKSRTPTPTYSHISTPPPTIETSSHAASDRTNSAYTRGMTTEQIESASANELRAKVAEFQAAYQEAKMTAAHHRLQYRMLAQESAAAIERMAVEARMTQFENEVIHIAEQNKATAAITHPPALHDGTIPVQKDLYQRMCREIQHLTENNHYLEAEHRQQEKVIQRQENEIASLSDKVTLMRDRIRENRETQNRFRSASLGCHIDSTPRSVYNTPRRLPPSEARAQPFAALLQASEMASQEAGSQRGIASANPKTGHKRNIHSMSSLPATPSRTHKQPPLFQTPQPRRQQAMQVPATAPVAHMSALSHGSPDVYAHQALPVQRNAAPLSDGTVSASEHGDEQEGEDSEAETEILDPDQHEVVGVSSASRAASQMLRSSREEQARSTFQGRGMLEQQAQQRGGGLRQGKLFGAVKKANVVRAGEDEPATKRARTGEGIGLGIAGVRQ